MVNRPAKALSSATLGAVVVLSGLLTACANIEWVDLIKLNDVMYYSDLRSDVVSESDLSPYGKTTRKLADNVHDPAYKIRNGDAAFLEPGTVVFSIAGFDPTSRVAAKREERWYIYEAEK